jgi:hypothetical protein
MILLGRYETLRMSQQAGGAITTPTGSTPASNYGDITTYTMGFRYNPFMTSRAGLAYHAEYNWFHQDGTAPAPVGGNLTSSELLFGFDFDF